MFELVRTYIITLAVFLTVDIIWLGVIAKNLYQKEIGFIMKSKPNWLAAIIFYLVFIMGLVYFVVNPALEKGDWTSALFVGMFFGFVTYATYDLTNLATLENWPIKITIIDLLWGTTVGGLVSMTSYFIIKLIEKG